MRPASIIGKGRDLVVRVLVVLSISVLLFTFDSQSSVYWGTFFSCSVSRVHIERMESKVNRDSALLDLYTTREKSATAKREIYIKQLRFERLS